MNNSEHDPANPDSGASQPSENEIWQDLVSRLENTESLPDDDVEDTQPSRSDERPTPEQREHRPEDQDGSEQPEQEHLGGPRDYSPADEDDRYDPEEPSSLAGAEPLVVLAWVGAIGGPLSLLLSAFIFGAIPMPAVIGIVVAFVASVVFLLMRLPADRGDDHDDGAIV